MEISKHPYKAFIPEGADKLIIGSIPPYRFCHQDKERLFATDVNFYYGSKDNCFWDLLSDIQNIKLERINSEEAIKERKQLLVELNAGITDIIVSCTHTDGKSDDKSLKNIVQKDISGLLLQYPSIKELIYTSKFIISQVNKSCGDHTYHQWNSGKMDGSIKINNKYYSVHILYSPSPNALRRIKPKKRMERYKEIFIKNE